MYIWHAHTQSDYAIVM